MNNKYILIGQPRFGTTYISSIFQRAFILNNSGVVYNEQLKKIINHSNSQQMKTFTHHVNGEKFKHPICIKEHLSLLMDNNINILESFSNFRRVRIIRRNVKETTMSFLIAQKNNKFEFWTDEKVILPKFTADKRTVKKLYNICKKRLEQIESSDIKFHQTIYYEDLTGNPVEDQLLFPIFQNNPITEFDKITVKTSRFYQDSILNYDEVLGWLEEADKI